MLVSASPTISTNTICRLQANARARHRKDFAAISGNVRGDLNAGGRRKIMKWCRLSGTSKPPTMLIYICLQYGAPRERGQRNALSGHRTAARVSSPGANNRNPHRAAGPPAPRPWSQRVAAQRTPSGNRYDCADQRRRTAKPQPARHYRADWLELGRGQQRTCRPRTGWDIDPVQGEPHIIGR